jgi:hypothetical protein
MEKEKVPIVWRYQASLRVKRLEVPAAGKRTHQEILSIHITHCSISILSIINIYNKTAT